MPGLESEDDEAGRAAFARHVKPRLAERLRAIGLDIVYRRASGDYLYKRDSEGHENPVLDLVGGFGSTLFGHNHPRLVARAQAVLAQNRPQQVQGSMRAWAGLLAERLSRLIGGDLPQMVTFASTGAEAVEAALKHAELERQRRHEALLDRQAGLFQEIRVRLRERSARLADDLLADGARLFGVPRLSGLDDLFFRLHAAQRSALDRPPIYLAVEGAFHGKTSGSVKLTHNASYQSPWRALGARSQFLPASDLPALERALHEARFSVPVLAIDSQGAICLDQHPTSAISACFIEAIQGEGGVRELPVAYLQALRHACDQGGFPLVADEIQCGMGRTGSFLAITATGVQADYVLLSKSLGGGLCKISALVIPESRYIADFGYLHTSTFADDDLSSAVALEALDLMAEDDVPGKARAIGEHLLAGLRRLAARYPEQIVDVRGRGTMLGVELGVTEAALARSPLLGVLVEQDLLGFLVSGYLLHEEGIRVAPTLSALTTIRLEPSAYLSVADADRFLAALERLAETLSQGDVYRLVRNLVGRAGDEAPRVSAGRDVIRKEPGPMAARVGFLAHFLEPGDLRAWEPGLGAFSPSDCERFFDRVRTVVEPFVAGQAELRSATGTSVHATLIALPFTPAQVMSAMRAGQGDWAVELIRDGVELARQAGCAVVGFGGYTSIVTRNCVDVVSADVALTSGNSLTAAAGIDALSLAADRLGLGERRLGIVGAAGNIGLVLAELAGEQVDEVVLVGRAGGKARLEANAELLRASLAARGARARVRVAADMAALSSCNMILSATNAPRPVVLPEHLADEPLVVCDIAAPRDVDPRVLVERPRAVVLKGGILRAPLGQTLDLPGVPLAPGTIYGCLAETMILGLAGIRENFSYGRLLPDRVRHVRELARTHGFTIEENRDVVEA